MVVFASRRVDIVYRLQSHSRGRGVHPTPFLGVLVGTNKRELGVNEISSHQEFSMLDKYRIG